MYIHTHSTLRRSMLILFLPATCPGLQFYLSQWKHAANAFWMLLRRCAAQHTFWHCACVLRFPNCCACMGVPSFPHQPIKVGEDFYLQQGIDIVILKIVFTERQYANFYRKESTACLLLQKKNPHYAYSHKRIYNCHSYSKEFKICLLLQ